MQLYRYRENPNAPFHPMAACTCGESHPLGGKCGCQKKKGKNMRVSRTCRAGAPCPTRSAFAKVTLSSSDENSGSASKETSRASKRVHSKRQGMSGQKKIKRRPTTTTKRAY